VACPESKDIGR